MSACVLNTPPGLVLNTLPGLVLNILPGLVLNTLPGLVRSVKNNTCFVHAVAELARRAGCKLTVCPQAENRNDRWIQVPWPLGCERIE